MGFKKLYISYGVFSLLFHLFVSHVACYTSFSSMENQSKILSPKI